MLKRLFEHTQIVDEWKKGNWAALAEWLGDFDISQLCKWQDHDHQPIKLVALDAQSPILQFEMVLGLIFAEYHKGLSNLLKIDEFEESDAQYRIYLESLKRIKAVLEHLYYELKGNLER